MANIFTFLIVRYYGLRDINKGNNDPECRKKFYAFTRDDIEKLSVFWNFPFYVTFLPRFLISMIFTIICGIAGEFLIGPKDTSGWRYETVKFLIRLAGIINLKMAGWTRSETIFADLDYSEYLGPGWKKEYDGASTLVSNHVSFLDTVFAIYYYYPTIVSRESSKHIPFVGAGLKAMNTVFVARAGADAKESKRLAAEQISSHQKSVERGEKTTPISVQAEGCCTRESELL